MAVLCCTVDEPINSRMLPIDSRCLGFATSQIQFLALSFDRSNAIIRRLFVERIYFFEIDINQDGFG